MLLWSLSKRDIEGRYKGSVLGLFWSLVYPLFMLAVYTFVFSVVFQARWGTTSGSRTEFALVLFAGLFIFNLFAECFTRAPGLILSHVSYVKKVVFPLEILPGVALASSFFNMLVSLLVWISAYLLLYGLPPATICYFPLILVPLCLLTLGVSWFLASLGVYLRDIAQLANILVTVFLFLSPIFYPASALPEKYRLLLYLNPLMPALEQGRNVLFWGKQPDWMVLGAYFVVSALIAVLGFAWFQKTRKGFADVL